MAYVCVRVRVIACVYVTGYVCVMAYVCVLWYHLRLCGHARRRRGRPSHEKLLLEIGLGNLRANLSRAKHDSLFLSGTVKEMVTNQGKIGACACVCVHGGVCVNGCVARVYMVVCVCCVRACVCTMCVCVHGVRTNMCVCMVV